MTEETLGRFLAAELARKKLTGQDLARTAELNKNTVSAVLNDRIDRPSRLTLAKIEAALGLTPGTLAGIGEDPDVERSRARHKREVQQLDNPYLTEASDAQLLAELAWRMEDLRRNQVIEPEIGPAPYVPGRYNGDADDDAAYELYTRHENAVATAAQQGVPRDAYERDHPAPMPHATVTQLTARDAPDDALRVDQAADNRPNQGRTLREHLDNLTDN